MPPEGPSIRFEPVSNDHAPLLSRWLEAPHVREWWGEPKSEMQKILSDRPRSTVDGQIVIVDDEPVGYIQSWTASSVDDQSWVSALPANTVGIDVFVGNPADIGRGLGSRIVRTFAEHLFSKGARHLVIDPHPANARAIAAYRKVGFAPIAKYAEINESNYGDVFPMELTAEQYESVQ
jgi:aminoglycoside 6'-N-acetyltransferase